MRSRVALVAVATLTFAVGLTACGQVNQPGPSPTSSVTRSDATPPSRRWSRTASGRTAS